ncbi:transcriptional regulator [Pseudomonas aeruginosa]|nr:transcriptional regulator [Pseudomonas aeruginosa]
MVKKFSDLRAQMSPEAQARVEAKARNCWLKCP